MHDLTILLAHRPGALAEMGEALGRAGLSVEGGGVWTMDGRAVAHFLFEDGPAAAAALARASITVTAVREVVLLRLKQAVPGQLGSIGRRMAEAGVNIEVQYSDHAGQLVLVVAEGQLAAARDVAQAWSQPAEATSDDTKRPPNSRSLCSSVRILGPDDVQALRAMLSMFGTAFDQIQTYTAAQPDDVWLSRLLASNTFVAVAAWSGTDLIGGIAGYVLPKFEQARAELYIYDLAVASSYRRQGVATAMIAALKGYAAAHGVHVIFVQADYGDEAAIALYSKLGLREDVLHFDLAPDRPPPD